MRIQSFENMLPASFCQERMVDLPTESIVTFLSVWGDSSYSLLFQFGLFSVFSRSSDRRVMRI